MSNHSNRTLEKALEQIVTEVKSGLKHGFFEYQIIGEIVKENKRKITIKTGKSYQYHIPEDEV
ncbi:hypothetical protein [Legionella sp. km772]|uniref:hypothetical protein n=1 Tax=Legionella sp. km772 TaxID=2498111 RepID=UPI000F8D06D4|nr:hypothetical protein [Legionella sp. km772]RUR13503.1 hypothetical protein ELY15_02025 [Legionella sp. km772]